MRLRRFVYNLNLGLCSYVYKLKFGGSCVLFKILQIGFLEGEFNVTFRGCFMNFCIFKFN